MQQYQVPQFIMIEDKIIGPLTLKQFFYLLGGGGALIIAYAFLNFIFFVIVGIPIGALTAAMAFLKIQERPFPQLIVSVINFYTKPRLYVWKNLPPAKKKRESAQVPVTAIPRMSESKLSELAWSLDIHEKVKREE